MPIRGRKTTHPTVEGAMANSIAKWTVRVFAVFAVLWASVRFLQIRYSDQDLLHDAGTIWLPLAENIFKGGQLYGELPDNKPPLFQFVNLVTYGSGEYVLFMLLLVGLANGIIILLTGYHFRRKSRPGTAVIAAIACFLLIAPLGTIVNNKSLGTAILLSATLTASPITIGFLFAGAIGMAQQLIIALPAVIWYQTKRHELTMSDIKLTITITFVGLTVQYLAVWALWGWNSLVAGIEQTIFVVFDYSLASSQFQTNGGVLSSPTLWLRRISDVMLSHSLIFSIATVGLISIILSWNRRTDVDRFWTLFTISLLPVLLIRAYRHYWILLAAGIGALFAIGVENVVGNLVQTEESD